MATDEGHVEQIGLLVHSTNGDPWKHSPIDTRTRLTLDPRATGRDLLDASGAGVYHPGERCERCDVRVDGCAQSRLIKTIKVVLRSNYS